MKSIIKNTALSSGRLYVLQATAADVEIIAHRGASYDAPENTLEAVRLAWSQKADAVEVDVFLSKDGEVVLHHDATTKKLSGVDRKVVDQSYAELRQLDVGAWKGDQWYGVRIPKLDDVLATIPEGKRIFIEVKCGPEIIPALAKSFRQSGKRRANSRCGGTHRQGQGGEARRVERELQGTTIQGVLQQGEGSRDGVVYLDGEFAR